MHLNEGKERFIESWGKLGSSWGISRTMAQVHALLLITPKPICAEQVMHALKISRGNANLNIRALIDWGLVYKKLRPGERKEYFEAEKDILLAMKRIIAERKKKELDPMKKVLDEISCVENCCESSEEFCRMVKELQFYAHKVDKTLESMLKSENKWLQNMIFNVMVK